MCLYVYIYIYMYIYVYIHTYIYMHIFIRIVLSATGPCSQVVLLAGDGDFAPALDTFRRPLLFLAQDPPYCHWYFSDRLTKNFALFFVINGFFFVSAIPPSC